MRPSVFRVHHSAVTSTPEANRASADIAPVVVAFGAGVDSTAMLLEMVAQGRRIDLVLFADTGSEKPETYAYRDLIFRWLRRRGIRCETVRYEPRRFKHWPPYRTLDENCFTNGTLPSISFGRHSCSLGLAPKSVLLPNSCVVMFQADRRAYPKSWRWSA